MLHLAFLLFALADVTLSQPVIISVNVTSSSLQPISPLIYGVAFASTADLIAMNAPSNRSTCLTLKN